MMDTLTLKRKDFDKLGSLYAPHPDVEVQAENINGISSYWFLPNGKQDGPIAINLHGGGYVKGGIESHRNMLTHFAAKLEVRVLLIEYRLAPEHPHPAGIEDALSVYQYIREQTADNIFLIGDSAGGGLAVAAIKTMVKKGIVLPQAVVLLSPWVYLEAEADSYEANRATDPILTPEGIKEYADWYRGTHSVADASPGRGALQQFPPTLIQVGSGEIILDDSKDFFAEAGKVQPNVILSIYNNAPHVWLLGDIHSVHSKNALAEMKSFLAALTK